MKLEEGKAYVFKDDAAREEFLRINPYNEFIIKGNGGLFEITSIDHDGDAETLQSEYINPKELYLFKESKPFDITEYKLNGEYDHIIEDGKLFMVGDYCVDYEITKEAAINYAKHFKLI